MNRLSNRAALSLLELLATLAVVAIVATLILQRATSGTASSRSAACAAIRGDIEIQAELWRHHTGSWPATNLSNIGGDANYFPTGVPACPVNGSLYTIDSSGRVVGHNH
jgi:general secretion pathway protein G